MNLCMVHSEAINNCLESSIFNELCLCIWHLRTVPLKVDFHSFVSSVNPTHSSSNRCVLLLRTVPLDVDLFLLLCNHYPIVFE